MNGSNLYASLRKKSINEGRRTPLTLSEDWTTVQTVIVILILSLSNQYAASANANADANYHLTESTHLICFGTCHRRRRCLRRDGSALALFTWLTSLLFEKRVRFSRWQSCVMAFVRLYLLIVLLFLVLTVDGSVSTTPVTVKSETKPLTGPLLTNLTSLTTSSTTDKSSQPVITTEFKRGQYNILYLLSFFLFPQFLMNLLI